MINQNLKLLDLSIKEVSRFLGEKEVSSVELTKEVFRHVKKTDPKIRAFITLCEKEALEQAKESDKRRARGLSKSRIDGIPISIKDNILTKGIKTTAGSKMLENFVAPYDATIIERLKNAGAVIIGKTNLDAWAHGSSTENSDFFTTHNPHDLSRVPGGSSGGSCAAVASVMGFASIGTDTGGSIRQPAGFCGVVGLKPTYGRVSRYGLVAMASSLDCPGPIAKTSEDVAILLEIICGHDPKDSTTVPRRKFSARKIFNFQFSISKQIPSSKSQISKQITNHKSPLDFARGRQITNLKIGLPREYFAKGLDPKVEKSVMDAVGKLEKAGAKIKKISLPYTDYSLAVYYIIQPAEVSSNLARYDGICYGHQTKNAKNLEELYLKSRAEGFGAEAKRRIMIGTHVLSSGYYDAYYKKAMWVRSLVCQDFEKAFREVDVIITPTSPTLPFKIGQNISDPLAMYLSDVYTVSANIAGIPGVSIPCGYAKIPNSKSQISNKFQISKQIINHQSEILNFPVGMQILGPKFSEEKILSLANFYEEIS